MGRIRVSQSANITDSRPRHDFMSQQCGPTRLLQLSSVLGPRCQLLGAKIKPRSSGLVRSSANQSRICDDMATICAQGTSPRLTFAATGDVRRAQSIWMGLRACFGHKKIENQRCQINLHTKVNSQQFTQKTCKHKANVPHTICLRIRNAPQAGYRKLSKSNRLSSI